MRHCFMMMDNSAAKLDGLEKLNWLKIIVAEGIRQTDLKGMGMGSGRISASLVAALLSMALAAPVIAQDDGMLHGDEAIAKRQELMKANGPLLRSAGGATGDDATQVGQTLVDDFTALMDLFPDDSKTGDTKALPAIWEQRDLFDTKMSDAIAAAEMVLAAAEAGDMDAYGASLGAMGKTCGDCHITFRSR